VAYFEKRTSAKGVISWRVQVRKQGVEQTRTFRTKFRAREWALQVEAGITGEERGFGKHTLLEAMRRYAVEVSPGKRRVRSPWGLARSATEGSGTRHGAPGNEPLGLRIRAGTH
jgi:hypothetical protein